MNLPKNPYILISFINTKLRDQYSSLELLVNDLDWNKDEIINILDGIGYHYDKKFNQFK